MKFHKSDYIVDLSIYWDYNVHIIRRESLNPDREWIAKFEKDRCIQFYSYGKTPKEALDKVYKKAQNEAH